MRIAGKLVCAVCIPWLVKASTTQFSAVCAGSDVVRSRTANYETCTSPSAGARAAIGATGASVVAWAGHGWQSPAARAVAYIDVLYQLTFHGPSGLTGRYQPCLTEDHGWEWDGTPITHASFGGIGSGGLETSDPHGWSSSSCGEFQLASTRQFTVGETLTAELILGAWADAIGYSGEVASASFRGFQVFDETGAPLSGVTWTLLQAVPEPLPRTVLLLAATALLGLRRVIRQ